ncbi:MAG: DUF3189 family protein [Syntrophomonadaceae bacterium]|nr:DUF3189 family protein [Syntrophomonadaceae bacterium]
MIIIYHCFGGSHSSVTAAALHLGLLEKNRIPSAEELMAIPYYDKTVNGDFGHIRFMGVDEYNNRIYVLGKKALGDRCNNILVGISRILGASEKVIPVNTMTSVNWFMKLGGFGSRRLGIVWPGRNMVSYGTQKAFFDLVNLVEITRFKSMQVEEKAI